MRAHRDIDTYRYADTLTALLRTLRGQSKSTDLFLKFTPLISLYYFCRKTPELVIIIKITTLILLSLIFSPAALCRWIPKIIII